MLVKKDYRSYLLKFAEADYYDMSLEARSIYLGAPVEYLCKSMVMENTAYNAEFEG